MSIVLIDADSLLFKMCHRHDSNYDLRQGWKKAIKDMVDVTFSDEAVVGIKGSNKNFRYDLYPDYKGTRPTLDNKLKKKLNYLHEFAVDNGAIKARDGWETDDEIAEWSREAYHAGTDYCIAHIDKDLDMLIGNHYNYNKDEHYHVDIDSAIRNYYMQLIMGDRSDNIPGVKGLGPVRAARLLDNSSMDRYYDVALNAWSGRDRDMELSARLLFMGDPEKFTYDLETLYVPLEEGPTVLHRDDLEDGETSSELLRDEQDSDGMDGPSEGDLGGVREEVGVPTDGTTPATTLSPRQSDA